MMNSDVSSHWTAEELLALGRNYQGAAVLGAAADLDLFSPLASAPLGAAELARVLQCNERGLAVLLDALAALRLLEKSGDRYALAGGLGALLMAKGAQSILPMTQHQGHCLRNWAQLASVVKSGCPAQATPSVRGEAGEQESFIGGMHNVSALVVAQVIQAVQPLRFKHLLDIGGASGTWTIALTQARSAPGGNGSV